jgi:hypothetical protein
MPYEELETESLPLQKSLSLFRVLRTCYYISSIIFFFFVIGVVCVAGKKLEAFALRTEVFFEKFERVLDSL